MHRAYGTGFMLISCYSSVNEHRVDWHDYNGRIHNGIHKWDMMSMRNAVTMSSTSKPPNFSLVCVCVYTLFPTIETVQYIEIYSGTFFLGGKSAREEIKIFVWYRASVWFGLVWFPFISFPYISLFSQHFIGLSFSARDHTKAHKYIRNYSQIHVKCTHSM